VIVPPHTFADEEIGVPVELLPVSEAKNATILVTAESQRRS
jgi:hypothetical protein